MAAVQPQDRPAGSQHYLEWLSIGIDTANAAVYPKLNGTFPLDAADGALIPVRFLLADTTSAVTLLNTEKQLPDHVFDDRQPTGSSPHAFVLAGATQGILTATDQNISARTWCQNLDIEVTPTTEAAGPGANGMSIWDPSATRVCLDNGASSGLGTLTGFPVVVLGIIIRDGGVPAALAVNVRIRVRHTTER